MRVLLLFRGSAGCGKSTYIKECGLKPYTLCPDDIRLMYGSPMFMPDGTISISPLNDFFVWNTLMRMLEVRMRTGEFTVIDSTNSKTEEFRKYINLAKRYRYKIYCIDMTDIPIEETKRRNLSREELKRVPDEVIDKFYARFKTEHIPSDITVLKPDEIQKICLRPINLSTYKKIHVVGDIHGCYTALKKYIDLCGGVHTDEIWIFTGDYVDRGIENAKVLKYLFWLSSTYKNNIIFLEGNHERWMWNWSNDTSSGSVEFECNTKRQLNKERVSKKKAREFYKKLKPCCYFTYYDENFVVTHGGISDIPVPYGLVKVSTEQMIRGVGRYNEIDIVDAAFIKNTDCNTYQIHGHRNTVDAPVIAGRICNLEGRVEKGGNLRAIEIDEYGITPVEIPNTVFNTKYEEVSNNV